MTNAASNSAGRAPGRPASAWLEVVLRIAVAGVLLPAGVLNVLEVEAFVATVDSYQVLSPAVVVWLAAVLPWIACGAGIGLLFGGWTRANALLAGLLFILSAVACGSAVLRGLKIPCACPPFLESTVADWASVVGLALMLIPCLLVMRTGAGRLAVDTAIRRESP